MDAITNKTVGGSNFLVGVAFLTCGAPSGWYCQMSAVNGLVANQQLTMWFASKQKATKHWRVHPLKS